MPPPQHTFHGQQSRHLGRYPMQTITRHINGGSDHQYAGHRRPLYRVWEAFQHLDLPVLFDESVALKNLNDTAFGRTVDRLYESGNFRLLMHSVALRAVNLLPLGVRSVHVDTTSISLAGRSNGPRRTRRFKTRILSAMSLTCALLHQGSSFRSEAVHLRPGRFGRRTATHGQCSRRQYQRLLMATLKWTQMATKNPQDWPRSRK